MYFSATIFSLIGFSSPTLASLSVAITNFIFTLVAFHAIDRVGRRRILLYSVPLMVVGLWLAAVGFSFLHVPDESDLTVGISRVLNRDTSAEGPANVWPVVILFAMVVYVAGYAIGLGCVPWQQSE